MAFIEIKDLTFSYSGSGANALDGVSLSVEKGDFAIVCGVSGCGKTTLLRHLKPELFPNGSRTGEIYIAGRKLSESGDFTPEVGFVMQDPDNQIVTDKVWHELAFGLESAGAVTNVIRRRVAETAAFFGMQEWYHMNTADLSGGQKQLLNLASVMVMQPSVLVLDEPTSRLDPVAASEFLSAVFKLNRELGITVIMTEHRLDEVLPVCNTLAVMEGGRIICADPPLEAAMRLRNMRHRVFGSMPVPCRIWARVPSDTVCPLTVAGGRAWLEAFAAKHTILPLPARTGGEFGDVTAGLSGVHFRYGENSPEILNGLDLTVRSGQIVSVIGGNGAGKSTMLSLLAGINRPYRGSVKLHGRAALMPQDPKLLFVHASVSEELQSVCSDTSKIEKAADLCGISRLLDRHPYDLSGGEQQKAALAKLLLRDPDILLCDEPTKGLDNDFKTVLAAIFKKLRDAGKTIVIASHDMEFCACCADEVAMLFDGAIVSYGTPEEFFSQNSFYTTAAAKMARGVCPRAVTEDDIVAICGGVSLPDGGPRGTDTQSETPVCYTVDFNTPGTDYMPPSGLAGSGANAGYAQNRHAGGLKSGNAAHAASNPSESTPHAAGKHRVIPLLALLFIVPLTLYFGLQLFGARRYLLISLLVMAEIAIPFAASFEKRRPRARELVLIASLCAIAIAGRAAFSMLPQFKPVLAIVIISGVALGAEAGAFIGAVTMLVSNMLFSQGSWTPWQMLAAGVVGAAAGLIFYRRTVKSRAALCVFGIFAAVVIYGGIMNPASLLMVQDVITREMLAAAYISGLPMDMLHAFATALFLFVLARPMIEKIDRIKVKYGVIFA